MDPQFFAPTVIRSSYQATATHNGCLLAAGYLVCAVYLLTTRVQTYNIKRLKNSVTYTVQSVIVLTLPQCIFYLFIAIGVQTDFPIRIGTCSFIKHFSSYAAQTSYLVPSSIAICRHLQLVWMFHPDRVHISLFIALMAVPLIGLAIAFTFFGMPQINDICAQLLVYQNTSVPTIVQLYLLSIQPFGIGLQLYNLYYIRRFVLRQVDDKTNARKMRRMSSMVPRPKPRIRSKYLAEYRATVGMIGHLLVILIAICLKFAFGLILIYNKTPIQSGALLKIIDLIPYTMPGWVGLISILSITDSRRAISYFCSLRDIDQRSRHPTISLTVSSL